MARRTCSLSVYVSNEKIIAITEMVTKEERTSAKMFDTFDMFGTNVLILRNCGVESKLSVEVGFISVVVKVLECQLPPYTAIFFHHLGSFTV
jgi:hypothetical protein